MIAATVRVFCSAVVLSLFMTIPFKAQAVTDAGDGKDAAKETERDLIVPSLSKDRRSRRIVCDPA